jgi:acetolactate synthase-1/2/3 large subunit
LNLLGAEAVIESLKNEGVEVVFGYPGGSVIPLYDALYKANFPHILTKHEQGAVHAADGYARVTGKVGVCMSTSGPGATNLVTGIATAYMDSVPLVAITGQVGVSFIGKDSFQEVDISGITMPVSKHNYLVKTVQDLPRVLKEAFYIARTGRPGPVVVDISKDVFNSALDYEYPRSIQLRGYYPKLEGESSSLELVSRELIRSEKPLIFVGGGINISDASEELREIVHITGFPVVSSLMGLGSISSDASEFLGMAGMHGTYAANMATTECDLLLGLGVRFSDRVTGSIKDFAPKAKVIHFDIDPAEINKNIQTDLSVVADLKWSLPLLRDMLANTSDGYWRNKIQPWVVRVQEWKQEKPLSYKRNDEFVMPQAVIEKVSEITNGDAIIATDVGQHQMWAAQFYKYRNQRSLVTSGGLGTMGYGLPAAIGAHLGMPGKTIILFTGDGSIMMNCQELATAANNRFPIKIIVFNNQVLGMVSQWQRRFYGERYSHTSLKGCTDFVRLAEAMGVAGFRVTKPKDLSTTLERALKLDGPVLVDVLLPECEDVLPMVPPGSSLDEMILGR